MRRALDDLLETARLSTLERWCDLALDVGRRRTDFRARARRDDASRRPAYRGHRARGEGGCRRPGARVPRALPLQAAPPISRLERSRRLALYERAEAAATSEAEVRDARWGQLVCMIDLELPGADQASPSCPKTSGSPIRANSCGRRDMASQLPDPTGRARTSTRLTSRANSCPRSTDPLVRSSFLSGYASALALASRYDGRVLRRPRALLQVAEQYRLDFALPYALLTASMAARRS